MQGDRVRRELATPATGRPGADAGDGRRLPGLHRACGRWKQRRGSSRALPTGSGLMAMAELRVVTAVNGTDDGAVEGRRRRRERNHRGLPRSGVLVLVAETQ